VQNFAPKKFTGGDFFAVFFQKTKPLYSSNGFLWVATVQKFLDNENEKHCMQDVWCVD
jgi:hypothetical protein